MIVVFVVCTALLTAGGVLAVVRATRGPATLDRAVALDVFSAVLVGALALEAAWSRRTVTIPILVVLSLVGFVSSVTIARFVAVEPEGEGRVRSAAEVAAEDEARRRAEEAEEDEGSSEATTREETP